MILNKVIFLAVLAIGCQFTIATDASLELIEVDHSETTIAVTWHLDSSLGTPELYHLAVDNSTITFLPTTERLYIVRDLQPCHSYQLKLEARFHDGTSISSDAKSISTSSQEVGPVSNVRLEKGLLSWDGPANSECVDTYRVCVTLMLPQPRLFCVNGEPPMKMPDLLGCTSTQLEVSAVGLDKKKGSGESIIYKAPFKEPGLPENMTVTAGAGNAIDVAWSLPTNNHPCIQSYQLQYGATGSKDMVKIELHNHFYDKEERISIWNLPECTDYTFELTQTSSSNHSTAPITKNLAAKDVEPEEITGLKATQQGKTDSVQINWNPLKQANCLGKVNVCLLDAKNKTVGCKDESQPQAHTSVVFDKLGACEHLTAVAKGYSKHASLVGPKSTTDFETLEKAPSGIQNLKIKSYTPTTLTVSYDAPATSPKCVVSYSVTTTEIGPAQGSSHTSTFTLLGSSQTVLQGLKPATKYEISIVAITKSHLSGPEVTGQGVTLPEKQNQRFMVTGSGEDFVKLTYDSTDCGNDCPDAYNIKYWSADTTRPTAVEFPINETVKRMLGTVKDLKQCTEYHFIAQTFSARGGWGEWTKPIATKTTC